MPPALHSKSILSPDVVEMFRGRTVKKGFSAKEEQKIVSKGSYYRNSSSLMTEHDNKFRCSMLLKSFASRKGREI